MFVAGHQLLWILAKSWRSANIWQVFKIGGRIYFTLLGFFYFFFAETDKTSSEWPKPKYIICKTPHYVSSSICLYPEISFECWDHLFARIELFLNENRYLRCHAERPVSGWVWSYFIWREWFSLSYAHGNKASWTHSWRATFNQAHCAPLFLLLFGNTILFLANPWSGKGRSFCHYFHAKKKGKNEFSTWAQLNR